MAGTVKGGKKAAATNVMRYGRDFYRTIGRLGGRISRGGGFTGPEGRARASEAGRKGGRVSRRGSAV